jgi:hypothetical protein
MYWRYHPEIVQIFCTHTRDTLHIGRDLLISYPLLQNLIPAGIFGTLRDQKFRENLALVPVQRIKKRNISRNGMLPDDRIHDLS